MVFLVLAAGLLALLVWVGRSPERLRSPARLARAAASVGAAGAAVVAALRGGWLIALALVALATWLGVGARGLPLFAGGGIDDEQARSILGVTPDATRAEIEAAWRQRMRAAHPDKGGPAGLAAKLNAARDRLLN